MTQETINALSDAELSSVIVWAQEETKARAERRKEEVIAKIKALAETVGIKVAIGGVRGRPARIKPDTKSPKASQAK
jgi:hypothetical protein